MLSVSIIIINIKLTLHYLLLDIIFKSPLYSYLSLTSFCQGKGKRSPYLLGTSN